MTRRVVITGFGVVSALGTGADAFFAALDEGRGGIAPITRFDASGLDVRSAGEVRDLPRPESAAERDFLQCDPKVAFAAEATRQAMAMAGKEDFSPETLLHIGTSLETFFFSRFRIDPPWDDRSFSRETLTRRWRQPLDRAQKLLTDRYGPPGQAVTNCSACAAGAQSIGQAYHAVRDGRFTRALAGGFDSMINPLGVGGFQLLGAPATGTINRGRSLCRPFDAERRGLVLGEGAAFVVLEERGRALAEGRTAYAEIRGYGASLDARSLSAPDADGAGAARAMSAALRDARLPPEAVDHINAHGTGTLLNDPAEARAIRKVFPDTWQRIPVAAPKSMLGHSIAAAGAMEVVVCIYSLLRQIVPPNIGLERVGSDCELMHVAGLPEAHSVSCVLTNSFGFGGQNASLLLTRGDA